MSDSPTADLSQLLVQYGMLTESQLQSAQAQSRQTGTPLLQTLIALDMISDEDVTRAKAKRAEIPYISFGDIQVDKAQLALVDPATAQRFVMLPFARRPDGTLRLAVADWTPDVMEAATKVSTAIRARIAPVVANEAKLRAAIDQLYGSSNAQRPDAAAPAQPRSATPAVVPPAQSAVPNRWATAPAGAPVRKPSEMFGANLPISANRPSSAFDGENLEEMSVDQPIVVQTVNQIMAQAINRGASDIHFEPRKDRLDIRYRIDGTLHFVDTIRDEYKAACTSRVKIMADMNIAERRVPQDGRISVTLNNRSVDLRVSSLPCQYGESIVMRILDKGGTRPALSQLGFTDRNLKILNSLIRKPHGIFLATGPTGSGKTTTLYSAIQEIHTPDVNIITVEDPIEYDLEGIRQSNVNDKAGLSFARQLRAILRQDPDVIYVGEIRDAETAEIAFRAALTGHLVFSTLHCNDASGAITRLLNMDIDPFLVASTVVGVMAQRLVRKVCPTCARPYAPEAELLKSFAVDTDSAEYKKARFAMGAGCDECDQTGYRGRYSVQELMVLDDNIRNMILQRVPSNKIRQSAMQHGMMSMRQDAATKVMQGITTFEEAQKRVFIEDSYEDLPPAY